MKASLNHVYRVIWNHLRQAWAVVSETAKTSGKTASVSPLRAMTAVMRTLCLALTGRAKQQLLLAAACACMAHPAFALPSGAENIYGSFDAVTQGNTMTITQHTQKSIVNWQKFGVASGEAFSLLQPAGGVALYRVVGNQSSEIYGQLSATGQLFLINPNGILFGETAQVNVGGLVASSLDIKNDDFLNGNYRFSAGNVSGRVVNQGTIKAKDEGYIVMLGEQVENAGTLVANKGSVVLASAKEAVLDFFGNGLVKARLTGEAVNALVKNSGLIQANGGLVQLATSARSAAINVTGIIEANQLVERDGMIRLEGGDHAKVEVSGQLIARGKDTKGGNITVTGEQVALMNGALLDASGETGGGQILVGGDYQGRNAEVYNARTAFVARGATLKADALTQGDGGKVIVWSDHATRYYGALSAKAGYLGGHGGFAEVSGKNYLNFAGSADLSSVKGIAGTLLLDPLNIELTTVDSNTTGFTPGSDLTEAFSDDAGLVSKFNVSAGGSFSGVGNNTNISLQAENDITVKSDFNLQTATGNSGVSLSLTAKNNINVDAKITADGNGSIYMLSDSDANGAGRIVLNGNITTQLGTVILLSNADISHTSGDITTSGGNVVMAAVGNVNLGNIKINTYDPRAGSLLSTGGNVAIGGAKSVAMSGEINTVNPAATGVTYRGGQGGNVAVLSLGAVDLGDTKVNVAGESTTSVNLPILGTNVAISGNVLVGGASVKMNAGSINTNGAAVKGAATDLNLTGNVVVAASGNVNLGRTSIDTTGSTPANSDGVNAGTVLITGQNLVTGNITANGTSATSANGQGGAGGQVLLVGVSGNLTVGDISVAGGNANGSGNAGAGATVNLTPTAGTVTMQSVDTRGGLATGSGNAGNGGAVNVNGNALIAANATINTKGATGGAVNFNGTVDSAASGHYALTVNSNATTNFKQSVGANKALASLTTDAQGNTELFGSTVKTTGNQTYQDTVNVRTPVTFETAGGNVTFNGVLNAAANAINVNTAMGDFTAMNAGNQLSTIKVSSANNVSVQDQDNLTINQVSMSGALLAKAQNTLTLNGDIQTSSTSSQAVQLVAKTFDNRGNHTISTAGRWLIYTDSPLTDSRGTTLLTDYEFKQYNTRFGDTILGAGDGFIYSIAPTVTATLTGAASKVYDGTRNASGLTFTSSNTTIDGDTVTISALSAIYDNKNVGTGKTVTTNNMVVMGENNGKQVYGIGLNNTTVSADVGVITPRPITVAAVSDTKVYDGNTSSSATPMIASGSLVVDDKQNFSQAFDSVNAGNRILTASGSVADGNGGANYAVTYATATGVIKQREITVEAVSDTKVYDGSRSSSATPVIRGTIVAGDNANFTQSYANKNAGNNKTISASGAVNDNNAGANYNITFVDNNTGSIDRAPIVNVSGITANDKFFDGTTLATLNTSNAGFNGLINGDQLTVATANGAFIDSAVGDGKLVNITGISLGGLDAGNYQLTSTTATTTASILTLASPRDGSGLGGLIGNNPVLNSMTIVSLNPAAGDEEDLDAVACPTNEDKFGSTPILNSGLKLPNGVVSNCI